MTHSNFSLTQLNNFHDDIDAFRAQLDGNNLFKLEGVSRLYNIGVLAYASLSDLKATLTIKHPRKTYHVSRSLLQRVAHYFHNTDPHMTVKVYGVSGISRIGLSVIIDVAQGRNLNLSQLGRGDFERVIHAADHLKAPEILNAASDIISTKCQSIGADTLRLIRFASRITALSNHFLSTFAGYFKPHLQRLLMRSHVASQDEATTLDSLVTFLRDASIPLTLEFRHWTFSQANISQLNQLQIVNLSLFSCTGTVDITRFHALVELRGVLANFANLEEHRKLRKLNIDVLPNKLPPKLKELTVRGGAPKPHQVDQLRKLNRLSLNHPLEAGNLQPYLDLSNIKSLKVDFALGSISNALQLIDRCPLHQLSLMRTTMSSHSDNLPSLQHLVEATLSHCDANTDEWVLKNASNLRRLCLEADESTFNPKHFPLSLVELSLDVHTYAHHLTALTALTNLTSLKLSGIQWSDGGLRVLEGMTKLQELSISVSGDFLPGDISFLSQFTQLRSFSYDSLLIKSHFPTTHSQLATLANIGTLTFLKIRPDESLISNLSSLSSLPLVGLDLSKTRIDWPNLPQLTGLQELLLNGCRWATVNENSVFTNFPSLQFLSLPRIEATESQIFSKLPLLQTLLIEQ